MYFRYFVIISPWKRTGPFIWTNLNPFNQGCIVPCLVENGPVVLEKKIFLFRRCIITISYLSPLGKERVLHLNKLKSIYRRMLCAKFCWKWPSGFWRRRFLNFVDVLSLFRIYLPLEKGGALHLNKLEFPSPKDAFRQVWLKLALWIWRRRFLNLVNVFSLFRNYLPLGKGGAFIWTNLNPLQPRMLCAMFGWNWLSGSGEEDF